MEGYTLEGKIALVTGVVHPVAQAAAKTLAEAGAAVAVLAGQAGSEHQAESERVAAAVRQQQRDARSYAIDVTQVEAIQSVIGDLVQHWGRLDILINGLDKPFAAPVLDAERLAELRQFLDAATPDQTHLLLSCTSNQRVLLEAARRFGDLNPNRIVFTKLDEAVNYGVLLSVAKRIDLELSYVTTGQEVPDHIEVAHADRLARLVLDGAPSRVAEPVG
jgi:flagellar biosynthesis protein FlhF